MRHKRRVHGTTPELTKCEKCGIKRIALFSHKCKGCQDKTEKNSSRGKVKTCGTCGFKTSSLRSHVFLRHTKKEHYLQEHYNVKIDEELQGG